MSSQPTARPERPYGTNAHIDDKTGLISGSPEPEMSLPKIVQPEKASAPSLDSRLTARLKQYDEVIESSRDLFEEKNRKYRDAIARTGVLGAAVELVGISARLESLVLASPDAGESNPQDVVNLIKDAINYAAIMGIMIMDDNWKPK